jgi:predicted transcriptional regulator
MKIKLSKAEEQLMQHLWDLKKAFMKDLIEQYDNPKPANTTIATLLKRMYDKGYITYESLGRNRLYIPLVSKAEYSKGEFQDLLQNFFGNSSRQFASFFTRNTNLTQEELTELRSIIDQEISKKKTT